MSKEAMNLIHEQLQKLWLLGDKAAELANPALDAMKALAEQPARQEPVAWVCEASSSDEKHAIDYWPGDVDDLPIGTKLYTSPPAQRTWVGLTDEEIDELRSGYQSGRIGSFVALARAIEAKLKEKNT